jgi:hypothetical protein
MCLHISINLCIYIFIYLYIHIFIYLYISIYSYTYIYTYLYIYTFTLSCIFVYFRGFHSDVPVNPRPIRYHHCIAFDLFAYVRICFYMCLCSWKWTYTEICIGGGIEIRNSKYVYVCSLAYICAHA